MRKSFKLFSVLCICLVFLFTGCSTHIKSTVGNKVDVSSPKDKKIIISLLENKTITYTWNIKNRVDKNGLKFEDRKWINIDNNSNMADS